MPKTLNAGDKHLLKLILKDADEQGWTPVGSAVLPLIKSLPDELIDIQPGFARLTEKGKSIVEAMLWL